MRDILDWESPLDSWLDKLVFVLPDPPCVTFEGRKGCISRFSCSKSGFTAVHSSYIQPTSLITEVIGVRTICHGSWKYSYIGGFVTANVYDTHISTTMQAGVEERYPNSLTVQQCSVSNMAIDFHFSGGFGSLLQTLAKLFDKPLKNHIRAFICEDLFPKCAGKGSDFLVRVVDPSLANIVSSTASPVHVLPGRHFNWNSSSMHHFAKYLKSWATLPNLMSLVKFFSNDFDIRAIDLQNKSFSYVIGSGGNASAPLGNVSLILHSLRIDEIVGVEIDPLTPAAVSNTSLAASVSIRKLSAAIHTSVKVFPADGEMSGDVLVESFDIRVEAENLTASVDLVVSVSPEYLSGLYGDQLLDLACLLSVPDDMFLDSVLTQAHVTSVGIQNTGGPEGGRMYRAESGVDKLVNDSLRVLIDGLPDLLTDMLSGAVQGPLRSFANNWLAVRRSSARCPAHRPRNGSDLRDWRQLGPLVSKGPISIVGLAKAVVDGYTHGTGDLAIRTPSGWTVMASGLDALYNLTLRGRNYSSGLLEATVGVGEGCGVAGHCSFRPVAGLAVGRVKGVSTTISASTSSLRASLSLVASIDINVLRNLNVSRLSRPYCLAGAFHKVEVRSVLVGIGDVEASVDGVQVGSVAAEFAHRLADLTRTEDTSSAVNVLLEIARQDASLQCDRSVAAAPTSNPSQDPFWANRAVVTAATLVIAAVGTALLLRTRIARRRAEYLAIERSDEMSKRSESDESDGPNLEISGLSTAPPTQKADSATALSYRGDLSLSSRALLPLLVLANAGLFLYANFSTGASVVLSADVSSHLFSPSEPVFLFSLGDTVRDMWRAKVYPLAILIAFFSGAWPYTKLFVLLFACLAPNGWLGRSQGLLMLTWLDRLGKWSLVDVFVLVLMMGAFHVVVVVSGDLRVLVNVRPESGFYAFLAATVFSLLLGQLVLGCFRGCPSQPTTAVDRDRSREAVRAHCFDLGSYRVRATGAGASLLSASLFLLIPLLLSACLLPTFEFHFSGLLGWMLGEAADVGFSLWSLCMSLPVASGLGGTVGVRAIQLVLLVVELAAPLLSVTALACLWVYPLRVRQQEALLRWAEVAIAWSALDVQTVSLVAALLQVQRFASFVVGDMCDLVNDAITSSAAAVDLLKGEAKCFNVQASLSRDAWLIVLAAVALISVSQLLARVTRRSIRERSSRSSGREVGSVADSPNDLDRNLKGSLLEKLLDTLVVNTNLDLTAVQAAPQQSLEPAVPGAGTSVCQCLIFIGLLERMSDEPLG